MFSEPTPSNPGNDCVETAWETGTHTDQDHIVKVECYLTTTASTILSTTSVETDTPSGLQGIGFTR